MGKVETRGINKRVRRDNEKDGKIIKRERGWLRRKEKR